MSETYYRKAYKFGAAKSLMMCLPIEYIKKHGIKKGDYLKVITTDVITIKPMKEDDEEA